MKQHFLVPDVHAVHGGVFIYLFPFSGTNHCEGKALPNVFAEFPAVT